MSDAKFDCWAIVEVMGHTRYAGHLTTEEIGGHGFLRVDVPAVDGVPAFTKFLGLQAIFAITPVTEAIATQVAARSSSRPVSCLALPGPDDVGEGYRPDELMEGESYRDEDY